MFKLEIDTTIIYRLLFLVAVIAAAYFFSDIVMYLFTAYIIMSAMNPVVARLEENNIPRWFGAMVAFLAVLIVLSILLTVIVAPLAVQSQTLFAELPEVADGIAKQFNLENVLTVGVVWQYLESFLREFSKEVAAAPVEIIKVGANFFGSVMNVVTIFIFSFYMISERGTVQTVIVALTPGKDKGHLFELVDKVERRLGAWFRGQLVLMLIIGVVVYLGLLLLGIPFALPLAVLAGLMEIIPFFGPLISSVFAIVVGLSISVPKALLVAFFYIVIQQLENTVIVPRVMNKAIGMDPLFVIIALMVGSRLAGPAGVILSVPAAAVLMIIYRERMHIQR